MKFSVTPISSYPSPFRVDTPYRTPNHLLPHLDRVVPADLVVAGVREHKLQLHAAQLREIRVQLRVVGRRLRINSRLRNYFHCIFVIHNCNASTGINMM